MKTRERRLKSAAVLGLFVSVSLLILSSAAAKAEDVTATAGATVEPLPIQLIVDSGVLSFGDFMTTNKILGSITMQSQGYRTQTGGITLLDTGTVSPILIRVLGQPYHMVSVIKPSEFTLSDGAGHTLRVGGFIGQAVRQIPPTGEGLIRYGARLTMIPPGHPSGTYTGTITISVSYQ